MVPHLKGILDQIIDTSNLKLGIYQSKTKYIAEFGFYSMIAYFTPILFMHHQLYTGVLVNSMLIAGALYMKGKNLIPLIVLPSVGALSQGYLFGSLGVYLFYMLPFIWVGNALLIFLIKTVYLKKKKHFVSGILFGSALKSVFLFGCAFALFSAGMVPKMFLVAFGTMQFTTAFFAGMVI